MGFRDGALNLKSADGPRPYSSPIPAQFSKPPSPLEQSPSTRKPGLMQRTTHALRRTTSASRPTTQIPTQPRTRPVHRTAFSRLAGRIPSRSAESATVTVAMRRKPVDSTLNQHPPIRQQSSLAPASPWSIRPIWWCDSSAATPTSCPIAPNARTLRVGAKPPSFSRNPSKNGVIQNGDHGNLKFFFPLH